jgi:hypothetical protein
MKKYNCPVILVEDTVEEPMKFDSLMSAAHYLYDSDMSPSKPTKISIYTALIYAVKHNNRYKNYTIRLERQDVLTMQTFNHLKNILGFLSEDGVNNFNECFVDDDTPYNFQEAKLLYDEHLFNLLAEMHVDDDLDAVAELSTRLTNKFYYHPDNKQRYIKQLRYDTYPTYIPTEDITVVWQDVWFEDDCIQRSLVGFYYGEPDESSTADFSNMPLTAQFT